MYAIFIFIKQEEEPGVGAFIEEGKKRETAICTQLVESTNEMKLTKHM